MTVSNLGYWPVCDQLPYVSMTFFVPSEITKAVETVAVSYRNSGNLNKLYFGVLFIDEHQDLFEEV